MSKQCAKKAPVKIIGSLRCKDCASVIIKDQPCILYVVNRKADVYCSSCWFIKEM